MRSDDSRDDSNDRNSEPPSSRVYNDPQLGAGDPPDYSILQESGPLWALIIGEEHFTFLGYHSERRCQGPCEIL